MPPPPRIADITSSKTTGGRAGGLAQETEAGTACLCKTMSIEPRDCSHDPLNCERILLLLLATADMVGQTRTCPGYGAAGTCALAAHTILVRHLVIPNQNSDIIG